MACQSLQIAVYYIIVSTLIVVSSGQSDFCNICGDGNSIQFPQGVVGFIYEGNFRKNNCQAWQNVVTNNPYAISDEFCRNEMLQFTYRVCRCTRPDGTAVEWTLAPSAMAPTASIVPTVTWPLIDGIGSPTDLPLEWDLSMPSPTPLPAVVDIPTVLIDTAMSNDDGQSSLSTLPPTLSIKEKDPAETSGQPSNSSGYLGVHLIVFLILVESVILFVPF